MTRLLPLLAAILLSVPSFAQTKKFNAKFGESYELPRNTEDLYFFGNQSDGIMNFAMKDEELSIQRFDPKTLKKLSEENIKLKATSDFNSELFFSFANENSYWLYSDWDKQNETEQLFFEKLDLKSSKFVQSRQLLIATKRLEGKLGAARPFAKPKLTDKYRFAFNEARTVMLVVYVPVDENKKDKSVPGRVGFEVFDNNLKKLWGGEFAMPYSKDVLSTSSYTVDSKGDVYCVATVETKPKERKSPAEYKFEVLKFTAAKKKADIIAIPKSKFAVNQYSLRVGHEDQMFLAGTYTRSGVGAGGFLVMPVLPGAESKKAEISYFDFPRAEMARYMFPKDRTKKEKEEYFELLNLHFTNFAFEKDGSMMFVFEEKHVDVYQGSRSTMYNYFSENIYAARVSASKELEWVKKIPKYQRSNQGYDRLDFKFMSNETGYYFLYLDNSKNLNLSDDVHPEVHWDISGGHFVVAKISKDGKLTKQIIFDRAEEEIRVYPTRFLEVGENKFIGRAGVKKTLFQPLLISAD